MVSSPRPPAVSLFYFLQAKDRVGLDPKGGALRVAARLHPSGAAPLGTRLAPLPYAAACALVELMTRLERALSCPSISAKALDIKVTHKGPIRPLSVGSRGRLQ